jgi:peptide deformylase
MQAPVTLLYPDPRLTRPAEAVRSFDATLAADAEALAVALARIPATGLAGPHLGIMRRIVAIDASAAAGEGGVRLFVNPVVTWASTETALHEEGSVSLPGVRERIERPAAVVVSYADLTGETRGERYTGFMAACLQHEIEQCDGIFWLDRLSRLKRDRVLARYAKLVRSTRPAGA